MGKSTPSPIPPSLLLAGCACKLYVSARLSSSLCTLCRDLLLSAAGRTSSQHSYQAPVSLSLVSLPRRACNFALVLLVRACVCVSLSLCLSAPVGVGACSLCREGKKSPCIFNLKKLKQLPNTSEAKSEVKSSEVKPQVKSSEVKPQVK